MREIGMFERDVLEPKSDEENIEYKGEIKKNLAYETYLAIGFSALPLRSTERQENFKYKN